MRDVQSIADIWSIRRALCSIVAAHLPGHKINELHIADRFVFPKGLDQLRRLPSAGFLALPECSFLRSTAGLGKSVSGGLAAGQTRRLPTPGWLSRPTSPPIGGECRPLRQRRVLGHRPAEGEEYALLVLCGDADAGVAGAKRTKIVLAIVDDAGRQADAAGTGRRSALNG
jgi:hypothetical protein